MPRIDSTRGLLVLRIVYDGPAMSGKTTSLRALGDGVARSVRTPEERNGRTLYFDWLEYIGGLFEGRQICCQIVSVPGQRELGRRRRLLIEGADAVVCVLDTSRQEFEFGVEWLGNLVELCRRREPPVGVVLQANKRDALDAVPRAELNAALTEIAPVPVVEAVATASDGIREAFVLAVRMALDRVRALAAEGLLMSSDQREDADDLLRALHEAEIELPKTAPVQADTGSDPLLDVFQRAYAPRELDPSGGLDAERIFRPDPAMPGGMIWPPVDGRALLHEASHLSIQPARTPRGDWWASGSGWRFHSSAAALFDDGTRARDALLAWARLHAANAGRVSLGRAVILADAGQGRFRLWQLVRVEVSLREQLVSAFAADDAQQVAAGILDVASRLLLAHSWFSQSSTFLPCTLWTVAATRSPRPSFVGLMPAQIEPAPSENASDLLLEREIGPQLRELRRARVDFTEICAAVSTLLARAGQEPAAQQLGRVVAKVA